MILLVSKYEENITNHNIDEKNYRSFLKILRYWYGIAVILISFKESYHIIHSLRLTDWDPVFMKMDYAVFGVNPTQWIYRFSSPALTEFMQIIYVYYYFMIIVYGLEVFLLWKRYEEFKYVLLVLFICFFLSYLLYIVFPAAGPRFYLHNFYSITKELPGLFITEPLRNFLNLGESIPAGAINPLDFVQRDAMPSLHVSVAMIIVYLSLRIKSKSFYFYLPYFFLLCISTVYLRYHYVVDIFAGIIMAVISIALAKLFVKLKSKVSI